jgi:hypothetical protein
MKNYNKILQKINKDSKKIETKVMASEVLKWLIDNVESYVDNHVKMFKIDLIVDNVESMKTVKALQDLYRKLPTPEEEVEIQAAKDGTAVLELIAETRTELDLVTKQAWEDMKGSKSDIEQLFKRLVFYYELKGFKDGKPLIQELDGIIDIINFEYENFSVGVQIKQGQDVETEDGLVSGEKKVVKEYMIPEGFTCWIELTHRPVQRPTAMF